VVLVAAQASLTGLPESYHPRMPDPIATALIAGLSAVVGGLIATIGKPWGQDWVARQAEERASKRERAVEYKVRLERIIQLLGIISVEGPHSTSAEQQERELPASAYAVGDPTLIDAVERMWSNPRSSRAWGTAHYDASKRVGDLINRR
jgi:hypothetical protein